MQKAVTMLDNTLGKKAALALSGLVLFGFVFFHMLGNLQVFLGPEVFNAYGATLKSMPALLWPARAVLLVSLIVHVTMMIMLYSRSSAARPVGYRKTQYRKTNYASATMHWTGPALFCYILFHLAHFTVPGLTLGSAEFSHTDIYSNFVTSFQVPWVTALYCAANLMLAAHLYHGSWSLMQSMGMQHPRYDRARNLIARSVAFVITLGNVAMPLCVLAGVIS